MSQQTAHKNAIAFVGQYITPRNHLKDQAYIDKLTTRLLTNIAEELEECEILCFDGNGVDYVELKRLYEGTGRELAESEEFYAECDVSVEIHTSIYRAVVHAIDVPEILYGDKFDDIVSDYFRHRDID